MLKPDSSQGLSSDTNQKYLKNDPIIQKFLARIPRQIAATFTNEQLAEIKRVFGNRVHSYHTVDIRLSIPFFFKRFYFLLLMGKDRRNSK